ncbi:MAG: type II toxin-antitoxin system VapC family toxin [Collinsella sp.]
MVDANVWVDSFCVDHAESLAARAFIGQATEAGTLLFFPVHIAQGRAVRCPTRTEAQRSCQRGTLDEASARAIGDAALAFVRNMTENAMAVGADASDLWLADKYLSLHHDYEDNLVLAACKRAQVDYLVTNDRKLLEHADLAAKTPRQMMPILACRTRRRSYRLTRTVCGPHGRRCAKGPASSIYKSSALMAGLSASCSAAFRRSCRVLPGCGRPTR